LKYVVLVPDGAADTPLKEIGGMTPLEIANTPSLDFIARNGIVGRVKTIPEGMGVGSDVASLSLLGYDPLKYYTGRGPLEAAYHGIRLMGVDIAFRCNLVTSEDGILKDYSSGHISSEEAAVLIREIDAKLGNRNIHFYPGVGYRHLMILKKGGSPRTQCFPPHDVIGKPIKEILPQGEGALLLRELIEKSRPILEGHQINQERKRQGKNPANMIWLWGQGRAPRLPTFKEKFGLTGGVVSAVDVIKGIGFYAGLKIAQVKGATGYFDTNYEGKAEKALEILKADDFVFVHVQAPDEAGHMGDLEAKVKALEDFDQRLVRIVLEGLRDYNDYRVLVSPDHATPIAAKSHGFDPVPFAIHSSHNQKNSISSFNEANAQKSPLFIEDGYKLMDMFIKEVAYAPED
jgi:2,3-bisphosphoglycerate-independent phosphoglycerate mutase